MRKDRSVKKGGQNQNTSTGAKKHPKNFKTHLLLKKQCPTDHFHEWWKDWSRYNLFWTRKMVKTPKKSKKRKKGRKKQKPHENTPVLVKTESPNTQWDSTEAVAKDPYQ